MKGTKMWFRGEKVKHLADFTQGEYFWIDGKIEDGDWVRSWTFRTVWHTLLTKEVYRAYNYPIKGGVRVQV
jgi:hypothetical protein